MKTVSSKTGIRADMKAIFVNAPTLVQTHLEIPGLKLAARLAGYFDYIHFFTTKQTQLHNEFTRLKEHLKNNGALWISWPKGGQLETDLSLTKIIKIGYDYGMVESKTLSVNETWSAIKFTFPKRGKTYNNSYGKLKEY